jgi:hypothetical protein
MIRVDVDGGRHYEFELAHGASASTGFYPPGTRYNVWEDIYIDFTTPNRVRNNRVIPQNRNAQETFINTYNEPPREMGSLTVTKRVEGNAGNRSQSFDFDILIGNVRYRIPLVHGREYTITDIPAGTQYRVIERDYSAQGYTTTSTGASGVIVNQGRHVAAFVNTREALIPGTPDYDLANPMTGGGVAVWVWLIAISLALIGLRIAVFYRKKRK